MLLETMKQNIPFDQYMDFFFRILLACVCGAAIGIERSHRLKEAGVRTHLLVSCASALFIIISKYGFADMSNAEGEFFFGVRGTDPARIAAQVVSGISFLCAGVIFKQGSVVKGLTTAAGLWTTAGVGLSFGAGMIPLGIFSTILVLVLQIIMHLIPIVNDRYQNNRIEITVTDDKGFHTALNKQINLWHAQILESCITHNVDGTTAYSLLVKMHENVNREDVFTFLEQNSNVSSFKYMTNG